MNQVRRDRLFKVARWLEFQLSCMRYSYHDKACRGAYSTGTTLRSCRLKTGHLWSCTDANKAYAFDVEGVAAMTYETMKCLLDEVLVHTIEGCSETLYLCELEYVINGLNKAIANHEAKKEVEV